MTIILYYGLSKQGGFSSKKYSQIIKYLILSLYPTEIIKNYLKIMIIDLSVHH